jgi:CheY-like chemotaxis protein
LTAPPPPEAPATITPFAAPAGRTDDPPSVRPDGTAATPGAVAPLDVLYVEDNVINAMLLQEMSIRRPDVALRIAFSGSEAEQCMAERPARLVLVDMNLGDCHGTELLGRLRRLAAPGGTRFLALSADAMPEQVRHALSFGFDGYLTKPLRLRELYAVYDEAIELAPKAPGAA